MTPEQAVNQLVAIVVGNPALGADEIYEAMAKAGAPDDVADRAYKLMQIAWGRAFLDGLGLRFPSDYFCLNAAGQIVESGQLEEEPFFTAARHLVTEHRQSEGFAHFAKMSADVNAINAALHAGSKPENLALAPPAIFIEDPTPEGLARAREEIRRRLSALHESPKKPWWRFWE